MEDSYSPLLAIFSSNFWRREVGEELLEDFTETLRSLGKALSGPFPDELFDNTPHFLDISGWDVLGR